MQRNSGSPNRKFGASKQEVRSPPNWKFKAPKPSQTTNSEPNLPETQSPQMGNSGSQTGDSGIDLCELRAPQTGNSELELREIRGPQTGKLWETLGNYRKLEYIPKSGKAMAEHQGTALTQNLASRSASSALGWGEVDPDRETKRKGEDLGHPCGEGREAQKAKNSS